MPEMGEPLSERELDVLRLVAKGATNQQIANELIISVNTVKVHMRNIFTKLGVSSRTEASLQAVRDGVISLPLPEDLPLEVPVEDDQETDQEVSGAEAALEENASQTALQPSRRSAWVATAGVSVLLVLVLVLGLLGVPYRWIQGNSSPSVVLPTPAARWTERAGMLTARSDLALVPFQEFLYAIGGHGSEGPSNTIESYDSLNNTWTPLASKPTAVSDVQAAPLGGRIYVPGGKDAEGQPVEITEFYEVERNHWEEAAPLPRPLSGYALVAFEGKLYLFGGWDGEQYRNEILQYEPEADRWSELEQRLPFRWGYAGAVVVSNRIVLVGGLNADGPLNIVIRYSSSSFSTYETAPLPGISLGRSRAVLVGDSVYILAEPEVASTPQLWKQDTRTKVWQRVDLQDFPPAGLYPGSAIAPVGTKHFVLVGGVDGENHLPLVQQYQALYTVEPIPVSP
jgi:DNA-binding CsgD family transcriptional regulator